MRLWSLHPKYLDPQGLVALWREGLLAKVVLRGETQGSPRRRPIRCSAGAPAGSRRGSAPPGRAGVAIDPGAVAL